MEIDDEGGDELDEGGDELDEGEDELDEGEDELDCYTEEEKEEMEKTFPFTIQVGDEIVYEEEHYPVTGCAKMLHLYWIHSEDKETNHLFAFHLHAPNSLFHGFTKMKYNTKKSVHVSKEFWDMIEVYRNGERVYFSN